MYNAVHEDHDAELDDSAWIMFKIHMWWFKADITDVMISILIQNLCLIVPNQLIASPLSLHLSS